MKARLIATLWFGITIAVLIMLSAFTMATDDLIQDHPKKSTPNEILKKQAFEILDLKCNVCHRKQNPFMVFKEKNMSRRANKIYKMVFVERRMPKGNEVQLSEEEYDKLNRWLQSEQIK